ncbi:nuclear transport factor 2 family protein [Winogradskyella bathintestinalis]|uniref:Nuclear transport factor 2 family protein n=1 Tax=Winogradskyella bathintestinalis TaxID=3035208 RepID=A0ABT7ZVU1_9FLAO|nr:nuclear transport factor 2 family protein [Winogradskyella bathintestinalis]MDN3493108.1 nuclear transport factor 2 family protein [Winogradskyella bathintestinalis]
MKNTIEKFYNALNNCDGKSMVACYHDDIIFEDPAFGILEGERAKAMWLMLCETQKNKAFNVEFCNVEVKENKGSADWEAIYTFSKTGRKVHNKINASFVFKDDLIIKHTDEFNLHKWAKQAMGIKGIFFGGLQIFKTKLQNQTNVLLDNYLKK